LRPSHIITKKYCTNTKWHSLVKLGAVTVLFKIVNDTLTMAL
jgi:hypothetical protein